MAASETRVPVKTDTRRELRLIKANEEVHTYDDAIGVLLDAYGSDGSTKGDS
ncbi:hypothetical protein R3751_16320 [Halorubrum distributum]|uniref:hypothetical protein n=1 Tax=Halorubrum distributum TaxID=29283 RepID=UPI0029558DB7|nr:hypothetical protein [Halorubrum distributum]MDV7351330.1 hypothetical protein [Halorubrum distributum]